VCSEILKFRLDNGDPKCVLEMYMFAFFLIIVFLPFLKRYFSLIPQKFRLKLIVTLRIDSSMRYVKANIIKKMMTRRRNGTNISKNSLILCESVLDSI